MASTRAQEVAEILWELKRAQKVAKFSVIAKHAGFSAGANGRTVVTTIKTIRRDWPHLEWWRAINDDGLLPKDSEHEEKLRLSGFELEDAGGKVKNSCTIKELNEHLMTWEDQGNAAETA